MNTDVLIEVLYQDTTDEAVTNILKQCFTQLQEFSQDYSRFRDDNILWQLNHSDTYKSSPELFSLLQCAKFFFHQTKGVFDPTILSALEHEGYTSSLYTPCLVPQTSFREILLDAATHTVQKPREVFLDFGGFGKGYIVDQIALFLSQHFSHFLIDAGGDIYVSGKNQLEAYPYWAIETEIPAPSASPIILTLSHMAVATSGITRRTWKHQGQEKHHLIDTISGTSSASDLLSVTVIAPSTVSADVLAKTLYLLGSEAGSRMAQEYRIPAIFLFKDNSFILNTYAKPYIWQ